MVLVFVLLLLLFGFLVFFSITGDANFLQKTYSNAYVYKLLTPEEETTFLNVKLLSQEDPNQLLNQQIIKSYEQEGIDVIVRKNEEVTYSSFSIDQRTVDKELQFELEEKGVLLRFYTTLSKRAYVKVDTDKLRRVIMNLITNSIKFMDKEDKRIELVLSENESEVIVRIVDNGCGIEPRALPYIFNKFYRAEESRNTQTGGSGLGLAIAKQIIDSHGGSIWATSTLHKETSIYFSLRKITK